MSLLPTEGELLMSEQPIFIPEKESYGDIAQSQPSEIDATTNDMNIMESYSTVEIPESVVIIDPIQPIQPIQPGTNSMSPLPPKPIIDPSTATVSTLRKSFSQRMVLDPETNTWKSSSETSTSTSKWSERNANAQTAAAARYQAAAAAATAAVISTTTTSTTENNTNILLGNNEQEIVGEAI